MTDRKRGNMACMHKHMVKLGDVKTCLKCGFTIAPGKPPFFDKDIVNYNSKKERARSVKNK